MANVIIHDEQRRQEAIQALRDYGITPEEATARQWELADCIAQTTKQIFKDLEVEK